MKQINLLILFGILFNALHAQEIVDSDSTTAKELYAEFDSMIRADPSNAQGYFMAGAVRYGNKDYKSAIPYLKETLKLVEIPNKKREKLFESDYDNDSISILVMYGICLSRIENTNEAIDLFTHLYKLTGQKNYLIYQGKALMDGHKYNEAITYFNHLDFGLTDRQWVKIYIGESNFMIGNLKKADSLADETLKTFPEFIGAYKLKGEIALKEKNKSDACTYFHKIITLYDHEENKQNHASEYEIDIVQEVNHLIKNNCEQ